MIATATRIDLAAGCTSPHCLKMAGELKAQLNPDYTRGAALYPLQDAVDWTMANRTARKRGWRAERLGYEFSEVGRELYADDIHKVNTSTDRRQGRPMSKGYQEPPVFGPNPMVCPLHHVYTYAILAPTGPLVAYLWLYRSGELAMVSSILGHATRLDDGIMYLLWRGMLERQAPLGGTVFYNLWNSGTDGLRFYKERVGLAEGDVEWVL